MESRLFSVCTSRTLPGDIKRSKTTPADYALMAPTANKLKTTRARTQDWGSTEVVLLGLCRVFVVRKGKMDRGILSEET